MKECVFCFEPAKMSGEHVFSDWMNVTLPLARTKGKWKGVMTKPGETDIRYTMPKLDWKLKVVCEKCNNGWMSRIEDKLAKPVMGPLIAGEVGVPVDAKSATSIATFAFKTAVIIDVMRDEESFFSPRLRTAFKQHLAIPTMTSMWMCLYAPTGARRADVLSGYYSGHISLIGAIQLYVCTYGVGHFCFQVVSVKLASTRGGFETRRFEDLSVPFWPQIPRNFVWPIPIALRSAFEFAEFHRRWEVLTPVT